MTVSGRSDPSKLALLCHWFVGDELRSVELSREELTLVDLDADPLGDALRASM